MEPSNSNAAAAVAEGGSSSSSNSNNGSSGTASGTASGNTWWSALAQVAHTVKRDATEFAATLTADTKHVVEDALAGKLVLPTLIDVNDSSTTNSSPS